MKNSLVLNHNKNSEETNYLLMFSPKKCNKTFQLTPIQRKIKFVSSEISCGWASKKNIEKIFWCSATRNFWGGELLIDVFDEKNVKNAQYWKKAKSYCKPQKSWMERFSVLGKTVYPRFLWLTRKTTDMLVLSQNWNVKSFAAPNRMFHGSKNSKTRLLLGLTRKQKIHN